MGLMQSMEEQGNFLFKYRGQFPIILFFLSIPFIYLTDYNGIDNQIQNNFISIAIILSLIGFVVRFYTIGTTPQGTSGRNTKEQVAMVLNSTGMYSMLRHPLYLGNYLIWLGIAVTTLNIYFIIIMSLLFWLYYERIMFAEEKFLQKTFGDEYLNWSKSLPAFIPSLLNFKKASMPFSIISVLRREYSSVLASVVGFLFIEGFRNYFTNKVWIVSNFSFKILFFVVFLVLVLRSLKHYTNILNEKGRS